MLSLICKMPERVKSRHLSQLSRDGMESSRSRERGSSLVDFQVLKGSGVATLVSYLNERGNGIFLPKGMESG